MRIGYGVTGGVAIINTRRRWLAILLALVLGAALAVGTATSASADDVEPVFEPPHSATVKLTDVDGCTAEITVTHTTPESGHELDGATVTSIVPGAGVSDPQPPVTGAFLGYGTGSSETYAFMVDANGEGYAVDFTVEIGHDHNRGLHGYQNFDVSFDVTNCGETPIATTECETGTTCTIPNGGGNWTATCEGCGGTVNVFDPGDDVADIEVKGEDGFALVVISDDRPRRWWRAAGVDEIIEGSAVPVRKCKFRERLAWVLRDRMPNSACFFLTPLFHGRLKYTVLDPDDPRFKFR